MAKQEKPCLVHRISEEEKTPILEREDNFLQGSINEVQRTTSRSEFHVVLASLCAALGSLCFGYCLGYSSPALTDLTTEVDDKVRLTNSQGSLFASLVLLGAIVGCLCGGIIVDYFGRKTTIMLSSVPHELGWLLIAYATNQAVLYAGRFVTGIGCGMIGVSFPVYVAEISSSHLRGTLGTIHQTSITVGILLSYVVGVFFDWHIIALGGAIMPALLVVLMVFMTETPRWYLAHNKRTAALKALLWLRGPEADVEEECFETERTFDSHNGISCSEFFRPSIMKPLFIGVCLLTFQQACGAIVVVMNCAEIFASAGFKDSKMVSVTVAVTQFLANIVACGIMDKVGRRTLLLSTALVMCFCHVGLGIFFQISTNEVPVPTNSTPQYSGISHSIPTHDLSWLAITCLLLFYISFSLSWGPVPWIIMSEIFPLRARGIGGSIASISAFGSAFVLTSLFVFMETAFTVAGVYWFYGGCCFVSFIFVLILLPETRGESLEAIETFFDKPKSTYDARA